MKEFGFPCKTTGCQAWLKVGDLDEDSRRAIHIPINRAGYDPIRLQCPDCTQAHDYPFSEKEIRRVAHRQNP
jgi:hypothetical protein